MKELLEAWEVIAEAFNELAKTVKNTLCGVAEAIEYLEREEKLRQYWYVPRSITLNHLVLDRKPMVPHMRNRI